MMACLGPCWRSTCRSKLRPCEQYLRRLLRTGRLKGVKIGQVWLIRLASLEAHLRKGQLSRNQRYGPQGVTVDFAKGRDGYIYGKGLIGA